MKKNEMEILRALSVKLDDDVVFVLTYQYHTEKDESDPAGKKNDKKKSRYRMVGFVDRISNVEKKIKELRSDENRLLPWKWENDPSWDGDILYMKDASNMSKANWLRLKLRKAVGPDIAERLLKGFKKDTDRKSSTFGQYCSFRGNAVYDVKGYSCSDGSVLDVDDFETLKTKIGQNVWKEIRMKTVGCRD